MNFSSDNVTGASPQILDALMRAAEGSVSSYGADPITARVQEKLGEIFERPVTAFPVATGTAANALALSTLTPAWGAVYCHPNAHIEEDECGAPEFFTGGAKLVHVDGPHGKFTAEALDARLAAAGIGNVHHVQAAAVSLTNVTEAGTIYTPAEIAAIAEVCRKYKLKLHMDGARFANALVALNCSAADLTWKAGVDVLSFGATKNGAMAAEAVVFFDEAAADSFAFRRKRAGHLFSKMRFLSAQLDAYLTDDLWRKNARHANAMARIMADGLARLPGITLDHPVQANEIFATLPAATIDGLLADGFAFYRWGSAETPSIRLVTSFATSEADARRFVERARDLGAKTAAE
ncbi:threonine aldolase family protein [Oceanibaculum pacificum]|uniref:L-threonine aldolase n=1 Tax=Oceanibaculum pacificum TaxID=580166 RepID=A0A154W7E0_9PROT|nr:low specificity L-threonine aldolase [Oceanibaculum pacificum]KZD09422.1 threonine aldolase [Oceanibaculum pacificum]